MKEKIMFIEFLFKDLIEKFKIHVEHKEKYKKKEVKKYRNGDYPCFPSDWNYMDKNHGKVALKRKITYLRQMLLNLERMLDE